MVIVSSLLLITALALCYSASKIAAQSATMLREAAVHREACDATLKTLNGLLITIQEYTYSEGNLYVRPRIDRKDV